VQDQDGTPDDGQKNCPKHVVFRTRTYLEISASVGFIVKKFIGSYKDKIFMEYQVNVGRGRICSEGTTREI
jgi:hypothetical protein